MRSVFKREQKGNRIATHMYRTDKEGDGVKEAFFEHLRTHKIKHVSLTKHILEDGVKKCKQDTYDTQEVIIGF